jgi:hypothetical protein
MLFLKIYFFMPGKFNDTIKKIPDIVLKTTLQIS